MMGTFAKAFGGMGGYIAGGCRTQHLAANDSTIVSAVTRGIYLTEAWRLVKDLTSLADKILARFIWTGYCTILYYTILYCSVVYGKLY